MLHHRRKGKSADKRNTQRVSHRLVVLIKGVLMQAQSELLIEILEENLTHIVALLDDDRILLGELVQVGECRTEHRVRAHVAEAALFVKLLQSRLHRCNVADDTVFREMWQQLLECRDGVFHGHSIDDEFRAEHLHLLHLGETVAVIGEAQSLGILFIYSHLVVEAEQVDEEASHLSCSHYQNSHFFFLVKNEE